MSKPTATDIRTHDDLARFVEGLAEDLRRNPEAWENVDLGNFLDALGAWIEDMDGYYMNRAEPIPAQPQWGTVAEMLEAARIYES